MRKRLYSVIIAGGRGTRFWPLSRSRKPKQLLKLFGAKTLLDETADRVLSLGGSDQTLVVTVAEQLNAVRKELSGLPRKNFLAEPEGKNTAPCIGLAALEVFARDPDAVMIILPADHWVSDVPAFRRTLKTAAELAAWHDRLVTIGIQPAYPETGYGYIIKGKPLAGTADAYQVKRFKEKPDVKIARQLLRQGSLWNAGIFAWRASTLLALMERYQPAIHNCLVKIADAARGKSLASPTPKLSSVIAREYKEMPSISIDHALLEPAGSDGRVLTVPGQFGWSDVGSWAAVHQMSARDANGNASNGMWLGLGSKDCLIHAPDRLVVLLGMRDTFVVDTPDALLVGDLKRSQEVRDLVDELSKRGYRSYTIDESTSG
ncbi:MAG TPA: sugar phosphate nucleotidyltransferase [Candidatus Binatia bacterium]